MKNNLKEPYFYEYSRKIIEGMEHKDVVRLILCLDFVIHLFNNMEGNSDNENEK